MKNTKFLALFLSLTVLFTSCKEETNKEAVSSDEPEVTILFKITVNASVKKDDNFCLLYTEDGSINFGEKAVWKGVKGSEAEQNIVFELPKNAFPTQFRLDLGTNAEQEDIKINSIKFEYGSKVREVIGKELAVFFRADPSNCTFDAATGIVKATVKDGKKQNPLLYPLESIQGAEIPKLYK
jgi:hypothetical protein